MFLEAVAKYFMEHTDGRLGDHCFVFPNRRSGLFFKRFLVQHAEKTQWSPRIVTINELMPELAALEPADPLDLLFKLYDLYVEHLENPEPFDTFMPWGEMMIADFDTLDKYLADPGTVFRNIRELKEIDVAFGGLEKEQVEFIRQFWEGFHQGEDTSEKALFLSTWNLLPVLYNELAQHCLGEGTAYEGLIYRKAAEADMSTLTPRLSSGEYVFIGFNALSNSEKRVFSRFQKRGIATFFWDHDNAYMQGTPQEAGRFMRKNMEEFPPPVNLDIFNNLEDPPQIRIFDLPSDILQAKMVHKLLSERPGIIEEASDTAIIACDENLLMPVLASLPDQVDQVNVTMGYPFTNTPLNSFMERVLAMYSHARTNRSGTQSFYYKDVLSLLNHQYFRLVSDEDLLQYIRTINDENHVYVEPVFFAEGFASIVFCSVSTVQELCDTLERILNHILGKLLEEEKHRYRELEKEYVMVMQGRLNKLNRIIGDRKEFGLGTFMRLFRKIMSGQRIPFTGEPLAGLQLMGILETRLLDFNHVIMLSVNEDVMPRSSSGNSFIPYSMRYAYGLPTREDMDAIYAYYFYRVIQRAEKVDLLFKSASEGVRSGEMSRYLYQLKYQYGIPVIRPVMRVSAPLRKEISIIKTPEIMEAMERYAAGSAENRYLSPSALNTYIECPLRFYFQKVARVEEKEELLEELDAIGFGNVLHKAIQQLYEPLSESARIISREELDRLAVDKKLAETVEHVFRKEYFSRNRNRPIEGRNLVILAILKRYLEQVIRYDAQSAPLEVLELEKEYRQVIHITSSTGEKRVALGGVIDRVDRREGMIRIIDYKTGSPKQSFENVASLFDRENQNRSKEAFQALVYAFLYLEEHPGARVQPGLFITREIFEKRFDPAFSWGESRRRQPLEEFGQLAEEFNTHLLMLVGEIFNRDVPFVQTNIREHCKYCNFREICERK